MTRCSPSSRSLNAVQLRGDREELTELLLASL
jgi:hypothetical protein